MRLALVSSFLADVTQQIHSFLASGVMSSHISTFEYAISACIKSAGILCTAPDESVGLAMRDMIRINHALRTLRCTANITLVSDIADQLLQRVFQSDESHDCGSIAHNRKLGVCAPKNIQ